MDIAISSVARAEHTESVPGDHQFFVGRNNPNRYAVALGVAGGGRAALRISRSFLPASLVRINGLSDSIVSSSNTTDNP
jgi:hypothetical protein